VLRVGFVGAGNYASTMLLPHLAGRPDVALVKVATSSSLSSLTAQKKFGFEEAGTDATSVVEDPSLDAVFIVTPHSSHARLTATALRAGRAVFVEKPLAIDLDGLAEVDAAVEEIGNRRLHVGFNRRFAPLLVETRRRFGTAAPSMLRYLVNAGRTTGGPGGGWQARAAQEGSRFNGEAGHFLDVMAWWTGADPVAVTAHAISGRPDDLEVVVELADGSIGALTYTTLGHAKFPKETFEAVGGGANARFDNFRRAAVWRGRGGRKQRALNPDKGQKAQVEAFCAAVRTGQPMPIPYSTLRAVTRATILAATDPSGNRQAV
jgi:predicted dehydrogenase